MITHQSIDLCRLTALEKKLLCDAALKGLNVLEEDMVSTTSYSTCIKNNVTLTVVEADDYETNQFSMYPCLSNNDKIYFLGTNHLKDAATIYKRVVIERKKYYYPHTLITKIDKFKLKENARLYFYFLIQAKRSVPN